ncbi:MAG: HD domain-containing protein [Eubacterium sp.]|nr:HD domain-containing protein [Eubacterium sp.]
MRKREYGMQIPNQVQWILDKLEKNGKEGYAVGGCVRDSILGRVPGDWDITTSATPEQIKQIFRKTIDTGIAHGTVTVLVDGIGYEITTYRVDGEYEDHRHPTKVEYTANLQEDLKRRDFTINAMAYNPKCGMIDLFDGIGDLQRKMVRCVGNAKQRFSEDALRMLRGIRFAGQLGFSLEEETLGAIYELAPTIQKVSKERIRVEVTKLLLSREPEKLLIAEKTGLCQCFLPELSEMLQTTQENPHHCFNVGEHAIQTIRQVQQLYQDMEKGEERAGIFSPFEKGFSHEKCKTILVYAALLHDVGKPGTKQMDENGVAHFYGHDVKGSEMAKEILRRLRFDNDTIHMVSRLIYFHERRYHGSRREMRRLVNKAGKELMPYLFLLQQADILAQSQYQRQEKWERLCKAKENYAQICRMGEAVNFKELAVSGKDLIEIGMKAGPGLGKVLEKLMQIVLEQPEKNDKEELLTLAKDWIKIEKGR